MKDIDSGVNRRDASRPPPGDEVIKCPGSRTLYTNVPVYAIWDDAEIIEEMRELVTEEKGK